MMTIYRSVKSSAHHIYSELSSVLGVLIRIPDGTHTTARCIIHTRLDSHKFFEASFLTQARADYEIISFEVIIPPDRIPGQREIGDKSQIEMRLDDYKCATGTLSFFIFSNQQQKKKSDLGKRKIRRNYPNKLLSFFFLTNCFPFAFSPSFYVSSVLFFICYLWLK